MAKDTNGVVKMKDEGTDECIYGECRGKGFDEGESTYVSLKQGRPDQVTLRLAVWARIAETWCAILD